MGEAVHLPAARVRRLLRLTGETHEVAAAQGDAVTHAAHALLALVDADVGGLVLAPNHPGASVNLIEMVLAGWPGSAEREVRELYMEHKGAGVNPASQALHRQVGQVGPPIARCRRDLVNDRTWYRSAFVNEHRRPLGLDDEIGGLFLCEQGNAGMSVSRSWGGRPFTVVDSTLARLFVDECAMLFFRRPVGAPMSPREREVLRHLLDGAASKTIAARLGLSINTVNQYIRGVYCAHGVGSRSELLSLVLGPRRSSKSRT